MANGSFPSISGVPPTESIGGVRCGTPGPWPGIALVTAFGSGTPTCPPAGAGKLAPLLLRREARGRAEPALEAVTLAAKQIENNHLTDSTMLRMARYRNDPAALQDLVQADRVHPAA